MENKKIPKNCLVFGANGFIGKNLCQRLLKSGYCVKAFDIFFDVTKQFEKNDDIEFINGDIFNKNNLKNVLNDIDVVFHLVSTSIPAFSNKNILDDVIKNIGGTINLFDQCLEYNIGKIIFSSSGGTVYGETEAVRIKESHPTLPITSHGISKLAIEKYCYLYSIKYGIQTICLRIGNPYGPNHKNENQGIIPVLLKSIKNETPFNLWGDGSVIRDFIHINDVTAAFCHAINYNEIYDVFNIGTGSGTSIKQLLDITSRITGKAPIVNRMDSRDTDVKYNVLDITRAVKLLDWRPIINLENGIKQTWDEMV